MTVALVGCWTVLLLQVSPAAFESELWPGEGRPRFEARGTQLVVRESPARRARIVQRLRVRPGRAIYFDATRYRTVRPGELVADRPWTFRGYAHGRIELLTTEAYYAPPEHLREFTGLAGDTLELLQSRAAGGCVVRMAQEVIVADPCPHFGDGFRLESDPKTEWWIRVVVGRRPIGWVLVDNVAIRETKRTS